MIASSVTKNGIWKNTHAHIIITRPHFSPEHKTLRFSFAQESPNTLKHFASQHSTSYTNFDHNIWKYTNFFPPCPLWSFCSLWSQHLKFCSFFPTLSTLIILRTLITTFENLLILSHHVHFDHSAHSDHNISNSAHSFPPCPLWSFCALWSQTLKFCSFFPILIILRT